MGRDGKETLNHHPTCARAGALVSARGPCAGAGTLTAGYSGTPLSQKLGISAGKTVGILNMPNYYDLDLGDLPPDVEVHRGDFPADIFIIFAERSDEAELGFQNAITFLPPDGAIWVLWPKQGSGVDTDLTEQDLRDLFLPTGMVDNKVMAVDETWSGLRFVVRKENREGWPESTREV